MGDFVCWGGVSKLAFGIINFSEVSRGNRVWTTQTYKQKHMNYGKRIYCSNITDFYLYFFLFIELICDAVIKKLNILGCI